MGLYQSLESKGAKVREYTFWSPDRNGRLHRTNIGPDVINLSPFPWTLSVEEGDVGDVLIGDIESRCHKVEYSMELLSWQKGDGNCSLLTFVKNHKTNVIETWHADYILGCDGARSKVREVASIPVDTYGELDLWAMGKFSAETNFPDIRRRCTIRSPHENCILTPCKDGAVRLLTRVDPSEMSLDERGGPADEQMPDLRQLASARGIVPALQMRIINAIKPFRFNITEVHWIEEFALQKSLAKQFSDIDLRVFLLGDACHIHSPISKQMMNGGLLDALNLSWKLSLVIRGFTPKSLLATYKSERRAMLANALELDGHFDRVFALKPGDPSSHIGFASFEEASGYTSGCGLRYPPSKIVREEVRTMVKETSEALVPGKRLVPLTLVRSIDGNHISSLEAMPPNSRFTILLFIGELLHAAIFQGMARFLASIESPLTCFDSQMNPSQSRVNLALVHTMSHFGVSISDLPQPFPQYPDSIFEDVEGKCHRIVGVSPQLGAICCVRPDGYLGMVSNLDDSAGLKEYLKSALRSSTEYQKRA